MQTDKTSSPEPGQLSPAVARDILFLGNALATVRSKGELQELLKNGIRRFISVGNTALVLVDAKQTPFLITFADDKFDSPLLSEFLGLSPVSDTIYKLIRSADEPSIIDLDQLIATLDERNLFHALHYVGFRSMTAMALRQGKVISGALFCFTPKKKGFAPSDLLLLHGLSFPLATAVANLTEPGEKAPKAPRNEIAIPTDNDSSHTKTLDENERDHILAVLKKCRGRSAGPGGAAELLGVPPSTLNSKMKKLGISRDAFFDGL